MNWREIARIRRARAQRDKRYERGHKRANHQRRERETNSDLAARIAFKTEAMAKNPRCHYCTAPLNWKTATIDHKIRLKDGGADHRSNYALACKRCNEWRNECDSRAAAEKRKGSGRKKALRDAQDDDED